MFKLTPLTRLALLGLMALAAVAPPLPVAAQPTATAVIQQARFCPDGAQSCYGDVDTTPDGAGSEDDYTTYQPPADFLTWAQNARNGSTIPGSADLTNSDAFRVDLGKFLFVLAGHSRFDPARVTRAILRLDFLVQCFPTQGGCLFANLGSDRLQLWDEGSQSGEYVIGMQYGWRVMDRLGCPRNGFTLNPDCFRNRVISLRVNLLNGVVSAIEVDQNGVDVQDLGQIGVFPDTDPVRSYPQDGHGDKGRPQDILRLAADGNLYGLIEDDTFLSYASLTIEAEPLPPVCPTVLDNFNRRDGPLGSNWSGAEGLGSYQIINREVDVVGDGPINWVRNIFGASQAACITFARVDPDGLHQSLMLKVRGNWRQGAVAVFYNAVAHEIGVETYVPGVGAVWQLQATVPNIELHDGDQLGARVRDGASGGAVEVYLNGRKIKETSLPPFFNGKTGRIGLWFIGAGDAVLDDFSGGTISP